MNFKPRYDQLKTLAANIQANAYLLWLLEKRRGELQEEIAASNDYLVKNRKVISEKVEVERKAQNERIMALNFVNQSILEATSEKSKLWLEFRSKY